MNDDDGRRLIYNVEVEDFEEIRLTDLRVGNFKKDIKMDGGRFYVTRGAQSSEFSNRDAKD